MSLTAGPSGSFYAAGYAAASPTDPKFVIVAKLTATGTLDTTFASNGVYTSTLEFKGGNDEIDIVTQSDGKIVVAATIANDTDPDDRDIGLFRIDATGTLDTAGFGTAGTGGFSRLDLSTAADNGGTPVAPDKQSGLAIGPGDKIFVHGASRDPSDDGTTPRTDTDFTVARLASDGVLDTATYGTDGKFRLDFAGANAKANATPHGIHVLSDGTVIANGYANAPGIGKTQPVLYRLTPDGALDSTAWSANGGVFYDTVLAEQTEVYNFAIDGDRITTAGYGRQTNTSTNCCNQWVSLRFDLSDGTRDTTFGGATNGAVLVDPSGMNTGNNCRNAIGLPGGKTALIGSAGPGGSRDAALAILTQAGQLDTTYGDGVHTFSLGGTEDQWWGGAVNDGKLMVVGWRGVGSTQTDSANDDAHGIVIALE